MNSIFAQRIKNARLLKGFSLQQVADSVAVSKQMIGKYENGKSIPSSSILIALAKFYNCKIDYFFSPFSVELGEINFRKRSTFSQKRINSIKEEIKINLENYLYVEESLSINSAFTNPLQAIKIDSYEAIQHAVLKLRKSWNIGTDPLHNLIQLLEDQEIKIVELRGVDLKFDGLATYINQKYPVIVINGDFPVERKRFTILHELGHLLLSLPDCDVKTEEDYCNRFAGEFLYPIEEVRKDFGAKRKSISVSELIAIQQKHGISIPAIIYRLSDAGIVTTDYQKRFHIRLNMNKKLKEEINESRFVTPEESNRFTRLVHRSLAQENISFSKASALLNKPIAELKSNDSLI
jgi:Zn-dependent peptidase ImmA (M78 family)/DNA-binding XRE family transcriptional regulator